MHSLKNDAVQATFRRIYVWLNEQRITHVKASTQKSCTACLNSLHCCVYGICLLTCLVLHAHMVPHARLFVLQCIHHVISSSVTACNYGLLLSLNAAVSQGNCPLAVILTRVNWVAWWRIMETVGFTVHFCFNVNRSLFLFLWGAKISSKKIKSAFNRTNTVENEMLF